ncbi:hypothetical protein NG796_17300 [Laspinema sp. A4]|nr:hypothetical protein [Laspinema sp. D2d]
MIVAKIGSTLHRLGSKPSLSSESLVPVTGELHSTPSENDWDTSFSQFYPPGDRFPLGDRHSSLKPFDRL